MHPDRDFESTPAGGGGAARPAARARSRGEPRAEIRDLISFRIHAVANLLSRGAALAYRREFDVSLMEWRTLALLGAHQPLSLNELSRHAGLDKSQMSRVVAGLSRRALVVRGPDSADGRGVRLTLSRAGAKLYAGLIASANRRNDAFAAVLSAGERQALDDMLERLADKARELIHAERESAPARRPDTHPRKETK
jgi:DNA-binding MarR family transcriptional regulator